MLPLNAAPSTARSRGLGVWGFRGLQVYGVTGFRGVQGSKGLGV